MYDADAIEAINFEQLVTMTDRLLLRGSRLPKRRPSTNRSGLWQLPEPASCERTVVIQRPVKPINSTIVLSSAIITTLLFIAALL
jgi:hypothetical protein